MKKNYNKNKYDLGDFVKPTFMDNITKPLGKTGQGLAQGANLLGSAIGGEGGNFISGVASGAMAGGPLGAVLGGVGSIIGNIGQQNRIRKQKAAEQKAFSQDYQENLLATADTSNDNPYGSVFANGGMIDPVIGYGAFNQKTPIGTTTRKQMTPQELEYITKKTGLKNNQFNDNLPVVEKYLTQFRSGVEPVGTPPIDINNRFTMNENGTTNAGVYNHKNGQWAFGKYAEGGDVIPSIINIEKGELQIDPNSGKVLREYKGINPETGGLYESHSKGKDTKNNIVTAEPGTFIVTKKKAKAYKDAIDNNDKIAQNTILQNISNYKKKNDKGSDKMALGGNIDPFPPKYSKYLAKLGNSFNKMSMTDSILEPFVDDDPYNMSIASNSDYPYDKFLMSDRSPNDITEYQNYLKDVGLNIKADGIWGKNTQKAHESYHARPSATDNNFTNEYPNGRNDYYNGSIDRTLWGAFGPRNATSVPKQFQRPPQGTVPGNPITTGTGVNLAGINPRINSSGVPTTTYGGSTQDQSLLGKIGEGIGTYGNALYNIGQGMFGKVDKVNPVTATKNPYKQEVINNMPKDINFEPIRQQLLRREQGMFNQIDNSTSASPVARANKQNLFANTQNQLGQLLMQNEINNNGVRSQRSSIYNNLGQQEMAATDRAQQINLGIDEQNRANQAAKENLLTTGMGQLQQTYLNDKFNKKKGEMDEMQLEALKQMFPSIIPYLGKITKRG